MFHENWYGDEQLKNLVSLIPKVKHLNGNIIEIGCWEGKSTIGLTNASYPEYVIANDTWLGNVCESIVTGVKHDSEIIAQQRDVYATFMENMNKNTKGNFKVMKKDCIEWLKEFNEPIKFCHIDASHEYESVVQTIELLLPKLVKGGILCGDDFLTSNITRTDLHGGVERAVREKLPSFKNVGNLWYWFNDYSSEHAS